MQLMAIVNVTPDSFFPASRIHQKIHPRELIHKIQKMEEDGADIFDIGGESTRPGSDFVPLEEELQRVIPVLECMAQTTQKPISIDTMKGEVAEAAIERGAAIINDVGGLKDQRMRKILLKYEKVQAILMHMKGTPKTMQQNPIYERGVVEEVYDFFSYRLEELEKEGIARSRIILDPGIGFGKTLEDNIMLMKSVNRFHGLGCQLLYGVSRKAWLGTLLGRSVEERLIGTISAALFLMSQGVHMVRVHDVQAHYDAIQVHRVLTDP